MAAVTVDDILSDLPLGFASLILRPAPAGSAIERFLILDADDETSDGGAAFVLLIGVRGRSALPALRRLVKNAPPVVAVKGRREELAEAEELLRDAGTGLLLVDPGADWDRLLSIAKDRIQPPSYQSEVLTLLEEDLFAIAQTTARLTSSHVVIEDAANKVLAYSTVSNDIDELRKASILARRGPRKYELLLKDLGAYRELHRTRLPVRVPARPQDGLRERVAITLFAGDRIMGYIWLQETGAGFGADVDYVLNGSAARASAELIRYRNQQSVHMREDRIARILSGPAEAAASAHSEKISADRPAALILLGMLGCRGTGRRRSTEARRTRQPGVHPRGRLQSRPPSWASSRVTPPLLSLACSQPPRNPGCGAWRNPSSGMPGSTSASARLPPSVRWSRTCCPSTQLPASPRPCLAASARLRTRPLPRWTTSRQRSSSARRSRISRPPRSATAAFPRCCGRTANSPKPCTRTSTPHLMSPSAPAG